MSKRPELMSIVEVAEKCKSSAVVAEPHLLCTSSDSGCGSVVELLLKVPEHVILFVGPLGCSRHISIYPYEMTGRVFNLALSEVDIVVGRQIELTKKAIEEIVKSKPDIRGIIICASCIDRLLATDYEYLEKKLEEKYKKDVHVEWMDPVLLKCHPHQKILEHIMKWIKSEEDVEGKSIAITLGRLQGIAATSEMRIFLEKAGIDEILDLTDCKNIHDFYKMAHARITIVMHPFGVPAAQYMKETYGIPYVKNFPSFDPDEIHKTYQTIGTILGREIDDLDYYEHAKKVLLHTAEKYKDKTFAVGEIISTDRNAFHSARTLLKYNFPIKYIYADMMTAGKEEDIQWIAENAPHVQLVLMSDPDMLKFLEHPLPVDVAIGVLKDWYYKAPETIWVNFDQEPHNADYDSIRRLVQSIGGDKDEELL